jgi:hypothetical protein
VSFDLFEASRKVKSVQRNRYGLFFVDHCTDRVWDYYLTSKKGFIQGLKQFLTDVATEGAGLVMQIRQFRSDSEPIYWTDACKKVAKRYNPMIIIDTAPPETPQLNGKIEAVIKKACGRARALLADAPWLPPTLWQCASQYACDRLNITCSRAKPESVPLLRFKPDADIDVSRLVPFTVLLRYDQNANSEDAGSTL